MQAHDKLLVTIALGVPLEARVDITHRLVERLEFVDLREGALHQLGILTEQLTLVQESVAQRDCLTDVIHRLAIDRSFRRRLLLYYRRGSGLFCLPL